MSERSTRSGIYLHPVYGPGSSDTEDYEERFGDPGEYPLTRGRGLTQDKVGSSASCRAKAMPNDRTSSSSTS